MSNSENPSPRLIADWCKILYTGYQDAVDDYRRDPTAINCQSCESCFICLQNLANAVVVQMPTLWPKLRLVSTRAIWHADPGFDWDAAEVELRKIEAAALQKTQPGATRIVLTGPATESEEPTVMEGGTVETLDGRKATGGKITLGMGAVLDLQGPGATARVEGGVLPAATVGNKTAKPSINARMLECVQQDQDRMGLPTATSANDIKQAEKPKIKLPSENAMKAWRLHDLLGISNQTELAKKMTQNGVPTNQGQVSKWLKQVKDYMEAGGVLPELPMMDKPTAIDPSKIDMGKRQDGRTPHQRERWDADS